MKPKHTVASELPKAPARPLSERFKVVIETMGSPPVIAFAAFAALSAAALAWYSQQPPATPARAAAVPARATAAAKAREPAACADEFQSGEVALAGSYAPPFLEAHIELVNGSAQPAMVRIVRANGRQRVASVSVGAGHTTRVAVQPDKYVLEFVHGSRWCGFERGFADASAPVVLEGIEAQRAGLASVSLEPKA